MGDYSLVNDVAQLIFGRVCVLAVVPIAIVIIGGGLAAIMNIFTGNMIDD